MKYSLSPPSRYLLLAILLAYGVAGSGQKLARQSINSMGSESVSGSIKLRQTVGQPYLGLRSRTSGLVVRQGFQQPSKNRNSGQVSHLNSMAVYPNPATEVLTLRTERPLDDVTVKVVSLNGLEMWHQTFTSFDQHKINCANWSNGMYIITLTDKDRGQYRSKLLINK